MDLEKYVLENYLNKIIKLDEKGIKYVLEEDIDRFKFSIAEKNFIFQVMQKYHIEYKKEVITKEDRPTKVKEFDFGEKKAAGLEDRDLPVKAEIEYQEGQLVFESYEKLDEFLATEFLPNHVMMTRRRDADDPEKEFVGMIDTKNGERKSYKKKLYPSIRLQDIVKLQLSEKETAHVLEYLNQQGIIVRGKDSSIDQEFENYDYYVTYCNQILPEPLTKEEQLEKFVLYQTTKDPVIKEQIILGSLRLVPWISWKYALAYDKDISEIESYGYEGLIEAVDKFDMALGKSFSTFAIEYIKGYIKSGRADLDYFKKDDWMNTFYKCKYQLELEKGEKLEDNVDLAEEVVKLMIQQGERELANNPNANPAIKLSKNSRKAEEQIKNNITRIKLMYQENIDDYVLDDELDVDDIDKDRSEIPVEINFEKTYEIDGLKECLEEVLSSLTDSEREVIKLRFGLYDGRAWTLGEVSKKFNVTPERVRKTEAKALHKLRHPARSEALREYIGKDPLPNMNEYMKKEWDEVTTDLRGKLRR